MMSTSTQQLGESCRLRCYASHWQQALLRRSIGFNLRRQTRGDVVACRRQHERDASCVVTRERRGGRRSSSAELTHTPALLR